jgi:predicted metal-dependent phosphoesterase TrpH
MPFEVHANTNSRNSPEPTTAPDGTNWLKADLHLHTAEDPFDEIDYTALELLEKASRLGFHVIAVTLHDKVFDDPRAFSRAEELGILLIQAAELRIEGADVVLLNLSPEEAAGLRTFDDLRRLRALRGETLLTFAPHPYYRMGGSIGKRLEQHVDCFDAVEFCHFHVPIFNPNAQALRVAYKHGLPVLATSDAHRAKFFGQNYSLLGVRYDDAPGTAPSVAQIFAAIRAGRIERVSPTGGWGRFIALLFFLFCVHPLLVRLPGAKRVQARKRAAQAACALTGVPAEGTTAPT